MTPEQQRSLEALEALFSKRELSGFALQSLLYNPWGYGDTVPPAARACHVDGHVWVETGTPRSWCRTCDADAVWDRETACWKEVQA